MIKNYYILRKILSNSHPCPYYKVVNPSILLIVFFPFGFSGPLDLFYSNSQVIQEAKKDIELNKSHLKKLQLLNEEYLNSSGGLNNELKKSLDTLTQDTSESTSSYQVTDINTTPPTEEDESSRDSESSLTSLSVAEVVSKAADENQERLATEIENLGVEIDMKKRLIAELEANNKNLEKMKSFYENKLNTLTSQFLLFVFCFLSNI